MGKQGYGERNCTECDIGFEPYQWNQKRCYDCIEKSDPRFKGRPSKICKGCGCQFQPRIFRQENCSSECGELVRVENYYKRTYGISREDYEAMCENNNHRCMICNSEGFIMNEERHSAKLVVDHCHSSGQIRGVLYHNCNRGLGIFQDNVDFLEKAIAYLKGGQ